MYVCMLVTRVTKVESILADTIRKPNRAFEVFAGYCRDEAFSMGDDFLGDSA